MKGFNFRYLSMIIFFVWLAGSIAAMYAQMALAAQEFMTDAYEYSEK